MSLIYEHDGGPGGHFWREGDTGGISCTRCGCRRYYNFLDRVFSYQPRPGVNAVEGKPECDPTGTM